MTRILAFSDVHLNLACVRKLRAQEENSFDVVVIAGDMGSEAASDLFAIVSTFDCPVYYVYGNWDNQLSYEKKFGEQFNFLHLQVEAVDGLFIAGFSGCLTHWGNNPISLQLNGAVQKKHSALLKKIENAFDLAKSESEPIYQQRKAMVENTSRKGKGETNSLLASVITPLDAKSERKIKAIWKNYESLMASANYKSYLEDKLLANKEIVQKHKQRLFEVVKKSKINVSRLMLVTHERMYRIHEEINGLGFHLFGHRHGFKHTLFKGTNYVNVSALDNVRSVIPKSMTGDRQKKSSEEYFNANAGNYCVIEIQQDGQNIIRCKELSIEEGWELLDYRMADVWLPSEEQFL